MAETWDIREGEVALERDPSDAPDAGVVFIGHVRSPWKRREDCPKNIGRAREAGGDAWIELKPAFAPALSGLAVGQPIILMYWMNRARRDLLLQNPRHVDAPRGTFSLRSPNRPNPVALSTVRITSLDPQAGRIGIDAIDCLDGTPVVDIKPWLETVDIPPA
ncbi:tRNA (N6-threonylcarbamoyladenosine(37)-N6)-methyltransferase TrmO [Sinisalibacter lacisalsi]|uniref:tRNA (N6-threonylcarbamoyladenosine(37)-N6)-methyltransferase TrmO n=1 Tax=Sinisalibacter lacisalsi TaxID=1526570 RepID=A0ABQ1QMN1_9RHOB|nr:tRNA (N6-threonylcarbamoyladenosine(37)-N6)-methyltransferase TrmO [Sinisalibacter lacisalsi]GGD36789.1 tRNA (N6-threonylcarbamoyladenosine(37)-N6)-methyltransferase TrmO [Sinisalibacter lacisalsi]